MSNFLKGLHSSSVSSHGFSSHGHGEFYHGHGFLSRSLPLSLSLSLSLSLLPLRVLSGFVALQSFEGKLHVGCPYALHRKTYQAGEKRMDEQGQIPESVKKLAVKAKDACERLVKDGSKLVGVPELSGVKDAYKTLSQHITNLNQLLILGELPSQAAINRNSLENFIGGIAKDVEKHHGEIQAAKARAKTGKAKS